MAEIKPVGEIVLISGLRFNVFPITDHYRTDNNDIRLIATIHYSDFFHEWFKYKLPRFVTYIGGDGVKYELTALVPHELNCDYEQKIIEVKLHYQFIKRIA